MPQKPVPNEEVREENLEDMLAKGTEYLQELRETLKDIKVPATQSLHPNVLNSVRTLFGDTVVSNNKAYITYDMYLECLSLIRSVGRDTAAEFGV